jgi:hypothetical protein
MDSFSGKPEADEPDSTTAIVRLEEALAEETRTSAQLRQTLAELGAKVDRLEATFARKLADALERHAAAEAKLTDQQARLEALGAGREESMRALAATRAELRRTAAERDDLRVQLARIDGMQTATIALEDPRDAPAARQPLPSIDELMASLSSFAEVGADHDNGHLHMQAHAAHDPDDSPVMISPELVFPEQYSDEEHAAANARAHDGESTSRLLVLLDAEQPVKYALYKNVMTIGRGDGADIKINSDFISRVHARLVATPAGVVVEDIGSKNGVKVNARHTERTTLRHGDVLGLGRLRFAYLETREE